MKYLFLILTILFLSSCTAITSRVKKPGPNLLAVTYPLNGTIVEKDGMRYYVIDHLELQRLLKELRKDSIIILDLNKSKKKKK